MNPSNNAEGKERSGQARGLRLRYQESAGYLRDQKGRVAGHSVARTVHHRTEWQGAIYLVSS